jgi:hypothetical protein
MSEKMHAASPAVPSHFDCSRIGDRLPPIAIRHYRVKSSDLSGCRNCRAKYLASNLETQNGDVAQAYDADRYFTRQLNQRESAPSANHKP